MNTIIAPSLLTALYHRPGNDGRWKLFDVYASREEAFRAVDLLPGRHPSFMLADVPAPTPKPDPTKNPTELTEMSDKIAVNKIPLPNVTAADLAGFRTRFTTAVKTVAPAFAEVEATAKKVLAEELAKVTTAFDKVNAVAREEFAAQCAGLGEEANAATE